MNRPLLLTALLAAAASPAAAARPVSAQWEPGAVRSTIESVAGWQLDHPGKHPATDWTQAAMYVGMMAAAGVSPDPRFREAMRAMGEGNGWKTGPRMYHADDHCVGQTYVELFELYREAKMLVPLRERFEEILAKPATNTLSFEGPHGEVTKRWSWCDALFMGPPAWLRLYRATGETRYRDFAVSNWWATSDYLYDREEHLFYRDSRCGK
jgi:unsaturated rhamnogalacturonyl hydrolase